MIEKIEIHVYTHTHVSEENTKSRVEKSGSRNVICEKKKKKTHALIH